MSVSVASTRAVAPTGSLSPPAPRMAIKAGLGVLAVPAHAEAVAIGRGGRFQCPLALHHQGVGGSGHVLFQWDGFAAIGNPAAHVTIPGDGSWAAPEQRG